MDVNRKVPSGLMALKSIVEGTSIYTGQEFFNALVKNLAEVLGVHGVWVAKYDAVKEELSALAFWLDDAFVDGYQYYIKGTPCEPVVKSKGNICHIPDRVIELFPGDNDLKKLNAVSYMGVAITDVNGDVMGHLSILDNKPMEELPEAMAIFKIFAGRATAEMRRLKVTQRLQDNEQKLKRVFEGAQEAIIEFDENHTIVQINTSGMNLLNIEEDKAIGKNILDCFEQDGNSKLLTSIKSLNINNKKWHSQWVQGYLNCTTPQGKAIPTEASISKYSVNNKSYYSLFLHSVKEQLLVKSELDKVTLEASMLKEKIEAMNSNIIHGESKSIKRVLEMIAQVSVTESTVLVTGETGTGKELVAQSIHQESQRKSKPLLTLNCAALPAELIESELFGHVKGAFTGAISARDGRFLLANNGTIFLDEIGELPLSLQSKLLRVLQQGEFEPLGSSKTIKVDVRIIAATNRNLLEEVSKGSFREDLYYRLNVFPIHLPPLRERGDDVLLISDIVLNKLSKRNGITYLGLNDNDKELLRSYEWPGNVRELQNVLERALILNKNGQLDLSKILNSSKKVSLFTEIVDDETSIYNEEQMKDIEKRNILNALNKTSWKIAGNNGAANLLGIPTTTLNSRIKKYGIVKA